MSGFGTGSNSNGQFWFGGNTFPGFLFKKNSGAGGRRSTKFNPGGNLVCNSPTYLYNKYKPGAGGIGASSTANRRAKNRLATVCSGQKCFPCYTTLGQYSNYTHNPNGFIPCPNIPIICPPISLADIATFKRGVWELNYNAYIVRCQTLFIPISAQLIIPSGLKLTNNGIIVMGVGSEITIQSSGIFNNNGTVDNRGGINVLANGTFNNNETGLINNDSGATITNNSSNFTNKGTIINNGGAINNGGVINNTNSGVIEILAGSFSSSGTLYNYNRIVNNGSFTNTSTTNNFNTFINNKDIDNNGTFNNNGLLTNTSGSTFENYGTHILNNLAGSTIINTNSTINNLGTINNYNVATFTNNSGTLFTNFSSVAPNIGTFINNSGGIVKNNNSTILNSAVSAIITNNSGATIYNYNGGIITNNSPNFTNNGTINNPTVDGGCGIGTLNGTTPIVATGTACP
jgi:hypothetical protein